MDKNLTDFTIDRFQLELEAERNGYMMRHYTKRLAIASGNTKDEKRKLEYIHAEQAELIRADHKEYGIIKPTDTVVFNLAKGEPEYIKQWDIYLAAYKLEKLLESGVKSCDQRGMMIGILAKLWAKNYYSTPFTNTEIPDNDQPRVYKDLSKVPEFNIDDDDIPF